MSASFTIRGRSGMALCRRAACEAHRTRRQTLNQRAEVVISEDTLHAATVCMQLQRSWTLIRLPLFGISIGVLNEEKGMQRILFLLYLHRCIFYTLISSPRAYFVIVVSHLLATSHTWSMSETFGSGDEESCNSC